MVYEIRRPYCERDKEIEALADSVDYRSRFISKLLIVDPAAK